MASISTGNSEHRPQKRRRTPLHSYEAGPATDPRIALEEERLFAQAVSNSRKDKGREPLTNIPFGPTFHPTVEDFRGDPLLYLDKIRSEAEKYGEFYQLFVTITLHNMIDSFPRAHRFARSWVTPVTQLRVIRSQKRYNITNHFPRSSGICKIVPPKGWNPPFALNVDCPKKFQTKDQSIHRLQEGISFGDGAEYTIKEYQKMSSQWSKKWKNKHYPCQDKPNQPSSKPSIPGSLGSSMTGTSYVEDVNETAHQGKLSEASAQPKMTPENLERDYWDIVETQSHEIDVDYGNDVDTSDEFGSGFPISERGRSVNSPGFQSCQPNEELEEPALFTDAWYKETYWNINNIPNSKNSVLRHLKVGINGINVPWLYFGCLFSTFCWHNEDNYMYSINYHHRGAPKQWYGVPGTKQDADGVERVFKSYLSMKMRDVPDLLHHITTSFSPRLLLGDGVPVCRLLQHAGEFIVTFPRAFHGGFSLGPNCGEAVNFALHDWIPHAVDANERYRTFARPSVFSHDRLVYTMAHHVNELRTEEICASLAKELRRLMQEELQLRQRLIHAGVRDVSKDVELPPNRLDKLDEESADYDDKRLCHSCKHICFFSAVCCECSDSKVSCLRHSHYMCRCSIKRRYILAWTTESEMKETISKVEKRGRELNQPKSLAQLNKLSSQEGSREKATGSSNDGLIHQTYEVPVSPICSIDLVPELVSSDTSMCSSR